MYLEFRMYNVLRIWERSALFYLNWVNNTWKAFLKYLLADFYNFGLHLKIVFDVVTVWIPTLCGEGRGVETPTKFSKKGSLIGSQFLEGDY